MDLNHRPPAPHAGALPGCATPRPKGSIAQAGLGLQRKGHACRAFRSPYDVMAKRRISTPYPYRSPTDSRPLPCCPLPCYSPHKCYPPSANPCLPTTPSITTPQSMIRFHQEKIKRVNPPKTAGSTPAPPLMCLILDISNESDPRLTNLKRVPRFPTRFSQTSPNHATRFHPFSFMTSI